MEKPVLKIFISSPSDVNLERKIAVSVIRKVNEYHASWVSIEVIDWKLLPMYLNRGDFQNQICEPEKTDLVIGILWSTVGTPLSEQYRLPQLDTPPTGTQYELMTSLEKCRERGLPDVMIYKKAGLPPLTSDGKDYNEVEEIIRNKKATDIFIKSLTRSDDGAFKAAYSEFRTPGEFASMLEEHLNRFVSEKILLPHDAVATGPITWHGNPYRSLNVFEPEHRTIFYGRDRACREFLDMVLNGSGQGADAGENGARKRRFCLLIGPSGSGKSSLVRAGVIPALPLEINGRLTRWHYVVFSPSMGMGNPFRAMLEAITRDKGIPGWNHGYSEISDLVEDCAASPGAMAMMLRSELARMDSKDGDARLFILVDQFEELFVDPDISAEMRNAFIESMDELAGCGRIYIAATMRNDAYAFCQESQRFSELKKGRQIDLMMPSGAEIMDIITRPAQAAGCRFEHKDGRSLSQTIADEAMHQGESLPLLEFALSQLYEANKAAGANHIFSFEEYESIGRLGGAISKHAESICTGFGTLAEATLVQLFPNLVYVDSKLGMRAMRQRMSISPAAPKSPATEVIKALVDGRLLTRDRNSVSLSHDVLLIEWPRLSGWIEENRNFLAIKARVEYACSQWENEGKPHDRLLQPGRPMAEAEAILNDHSSAIAPDTAVFIKSSFLYHMARRRRRIVIISTAAILFLLVVTAFSIYSSVQRKRAVTNKEKAEGLVNFMVFDLMDKLKPIDQLEILESVSDKANRYFETLKESEMSDISRRNHSVSLDNHGYSLMAQGRRTEALEKYQKSFDIRENMAKSDLSNKDWQRDVSQSLNKIGDALLEEGKISEALEKYQKSFDIRENIALSDPSNKNWQRDVSLSLFRLGDVLVQEGKTSEALKKYQRCLDISKKLVDDSNNSNKDWQRDVSVALNRLGKVLLKDGKKYEALEMFREDLKIAENLANLYPFKQDYQRDLSLSLSNIGEVLLKDGKRYEALEMYQKSHKIVEEIVNLYPLNRSWQRYLSVSYWEIGNIRMEEKKYADAALEFRKAIYILSQLLILDQTNVKYQADMCENRKDLGFAMIGTSKHENRAEAKANLEEAIKIWEDLNNRNLLNKKQQAWGATIREKLDGIK